MKLKLTVDEVRSLMTCPPYKDNELLALALEFPDSPKLDDPETIHYFLYYEDAFRRLRHASMNILEIGVHKGDSLRLWNAYFPASRVYGIDLYLFKEAVGLNVFRGDQKNVKFLADVVRQAGPFDIIIDDGSHIMADQIASLKYLFPHGLASGGTYVIEDLGTSYWSRWGGGLDRPDSTISFLKRLIDTVNYRAHKGGRSDYRPQVPRRDQLALDDFDEHLVSVSFARSLCVLRKGDNRSVDVDERRDLSADLDVGTSDQSSAQTR